MSPKVKTIKSNETRALNKLNKSSIQSSNNSKENRNDWVESGEPPRFNETINPRELGSKNKKPSVKTTFPSISGSTSYPDGSKAKYTAKFYCRRLKQYKTLINALISAKREIRVKKYIEKSVWIFDDSHERKSRKNRSVDADGVKEENPRAPRIDVIDLNSDSDRDNTARKSGELCKPDKKIPEAKSVPSTSKQIDESDDDSSSLSINSQGARRDLQNLKGENLSDSSDDITIITREQSKKESQGLRSKETKEASINSPFDEIGWSTITRSQKNLQKSNLRVKDSEDQPKGQGSNSVINSSKSTVMSKRNEKTAIISNPKNFNPSEIVDIKSKPATPGIGCLCKSKKLKCLPTLSYKVPPDANNLASKFCNHERGKSGQDAEIKETSLIHEKKAKKSYLPLELNYGEGSEGSKNLVKENEDVSKPLDQVKKNSASHERGSKNSEPVRKNLSKQPRCATFSTYSIPVSIEIHMVPDKMKPRKLSGNLKQSMLTNYYPLGRAQDRRLQRKNVDSNPVIVTGGRNNRDENGNKVEPAGRQNSKLRALPVVKSDVLLQKRAELSFSDKYPLQRPKLSLPSQEYLYNLLKYPVEKAQSAAINQPGNQNIIFCNNVTLSQQCNVTNEPADYNLTNPNIIDDGELSIVPPSYSVSSDDGDDDSRTIGAELSLDTDQWEEMFTPWDKLESLEKVNRWNVGQKC